MLPTTQLMNVVLVTHGGPNGLVMNSLNASSSGVTAQDINDYTSGNSSFLSSIDGRKDYISNLEQIFNNMGQDGNFIVSACNAGTSDELGKALQKLSKNRVNIFLTPDYVRISDPNGIDDRKVNEIQELGLPRIQDGRTHGKFKFSISHFVKGFVKFPAGGGGPEYTGANIMLQQTGVAFILGNVAP